VGLGGAGDDGTRGIGEVSGEFRRCLRPADCPYTQSAATAPLPAPDLWGAMLAELLPGDPELAWEITDLLVAEGVLGVEDPAEH
jgi:hypothetical protein